MKENLKTLKESTIKILNAKENLKNQKKFFNMKVEEQKSETSMDEIFNVNNDSYEAAKVLNAYFPQIHGLVSEIKNEHPKYGNRRIKELILPILMSENTLLKQHESMVSLTVDNYFLYESCGFFKLRDQEQAVKNLEVEAKVATDAIIDESKQSAVKVGTSFTNIVKPYGEVAKSQLNQAGESAKKAINKGSKKLIKLFEDIEKKTK